MGLDNGFNDGHSQACSFFTFGAEKRIEDILQDFRIDSRARIFDPNTKMFPFNVSCNADNPGFDNGFQAVFHQVGYRLKNFEYIFKDGGNPPEKYSEENRY